MSKTDFKTQTKYYIKNSSHEKDILKLKKSGFSYREIKKKLHCSNDCISSVLKNNNLKEKENIKYNYPKDCNKELMKNKHVKIKYISGYKNSKENATFQFVNCGHIVSKSWEKIKNIQECPICRKNRLNKKQAISKLISTIKIIEKSKENLLKEEKNNYEVDIRNCEICFKEFICKKSDPRKTCCSKCSEIYRKHKKNEKHDSRINKYNTKDFDITLDKLFKRDKGICQICNHKCINILNSNDDLYPSIDHIIPLSKGGLHAWNNVQLAHRICNSIKKDIYVPKEANFNAIF